VDDDEIVSDNWLDTLYQCMNEYNADVVIGPVFNKYSKTCPAWLAGGDLMARINPRTGQKLKTGHTGNALVSTAALKKNSIKFDECLGHTGGEDTNFFFRLYCLGARIIGCQEAVAFEVVDPSRENMNYLVQENKRIGQVYCVAIWPFLRGWQSVFAIFLILVKVLVFGIGFSMTFVFGRRYSAYWKLRCICNLEKLRYLVMQNKTVKPYAVR